jgi:hypothetical protein
VSDSLYISGRIKDKHSDYILSDDMNQKASKQIKITMKLSDHTVQGFLFEGDHSTDYQESLMNDYSAVLMGRKTYEFGLQFGVKSPYT